MKNDQMDDEAELKKRGLASADKVGFLERIRMGNIDDPQLRGIYKNLALGVVGRRLLKQKHLRLIK
jgi:hypothetical protein